MRYSIYATLLVLFVAAPAAAESISVNEAVEIFESVMVEPSNGHWECHCVCFVYDPHIGISKAEIDGRCEDDYEGEKCEGKTRLGEKGTGTLTDCENKFIIGD